VSQQRLNWLLLLGLSLVWGSSFFLIKKTLVTFQPIQVACLRMGIAGIVLSPFLYKEIKTLKREDIRWILVVGFTGSAIPAICFGFAQTHLSSGIAGVLNSLTPLFTLVVGILFFAVKAKSRMILGVLIGLIGALMTIIKAIDGPMEANLFFGALVVLASICYATSSNVVMHHLTHRKSFSISVLAYGALLPFSLLILFSTDFIHRLQTEEQALMSLGAATFLALFGTAIASTFFFMLVQRTSALFASTITYLIPIIATILGSFDGEAVSIYHGIGLLFIISGVYLSRK